MDKNVFAGYGQEHLKYATPDKMLLLITLLKVAKNWRGPCLGLPVATFVLLRLIDGGEAAETGNVCL